jgi:hypothetical protein
MEEAREEELQAIRILGCMVSFWQAMMTMAVMIDNVEMVASN